MILRFVGACRESSLGVGRRCGVFATLGVVVASFV